VAASLSWNAQINANPDGDDAVPHGEAKIFGSFDGPRRVALSQLILLSQVIQW
jgi:hypothetical protein